MTKITIDDLVVMIAKGFSAVDERFNQLEVKMDSLEARHDRRLRLLENRVFPIKST